MTYEELMPLVQQINAPLTAEDRLPDEEFLRDDQRYQIVYVAAKYFDDGVVTYDEFVPLVFREGRLIAKGWAFLGGPYTTNRHTQAQRPPPRVRLGLGVGVGTTIR